MNNLLEALLVMIIGLSGVFLSLLFFYIIIFFLQKSDEKLNKYLVQKKLEPNIIDTNITQIKPEIVAAISAAVFETFHKKIVIKKIHFLDDDKSSQWATSGRINIMGSHNLKK
jgi:Na+-transporting methylmalonyl-CoA/oxaloacetate decarboxylase gamma subunit